MRRAVILSAMGIGLLRAAGDWMLEPGIRVEQGSVPYILRLDDRSYRLYFCGPGGIRSARSRDGVQFALEEGVRLPSMGGPGAPESAVCDPSMVRLDDGRYRMYYKGATGPGGPGQSVHRVYSAISADAFQFTREGLRLESAGTPDAGWASVPEVIRTFDGRFRMYYVTANPEFPNGIASAVSDDGLTFTREPGARVTGWVDPAIVRLPNGLYWMFGMAGGFSPNVTRSISSAHSADGLNFAPDSGDRLAAGDPGLPNEFYDPTVIDLGDGRFRMYFGGRQGNAVVTMSAVGSYRQPPAFGTVEARSAADGALRRIAAASLVSLYGEGPFGDRATVLLNGRSAGVLYASAAQINLVTPTDLPLGPTQVVVRGDEGRISTGMTSTASCAAAVFTENSAGTGLAAALDAVRFTPGPFSPGAAVAVFSTGLRSARSVSAGLGGRDIPVLYAGPQPQYAGLDQVNLAIPPDFPLRGPLPLVLAAEECRSNPEVILEIR